MTIENCIEVGNVARSVGATDDRGTDGDDVRDETGDKDHAAVGEDDDGWRF